MHCVWKQNNGRYVSKIPYVLDDNFFISLGLKDKRFIASMSASWQFPDEFSGRVLWMDDDGVTSLRYSIVGVCHLFSFHQSYHRPLEVMTMTQRVVTRISQYF